MTRPRVACIASLIPLLLFASAASVGGQETPSGQEEFDMAKELKDKIVLLEVNRSSAVESKTFSALLREARIVKLGGRHFILGKSVDRWGSQVSTEGMLLGVPWDSVLRIQVMNQKQFEKYIEQWKDYEDEE